MWQCCASLRIIELAFFLQMTIDKVNLIPTMKVISLCKEDSLQSTSFKDKHSSFFLCSFMTLFYILLSFKNLFR